MNTYHILYKENLSDFYAKGFNIESQSMSSAIISFEEQNPNVEVIFCMDLNSVNYIPKNKRES